MLANETVADYKWTLEGAVGSHFVTEIWKLFCVQAKVIGVQIERFGNI